MDGAVVVQNAAAPLSPASPSSQSSLRYMPGLDVVRGVAIGAVLFYHGIGPKVDFFQSFHARWSSALLALSLYGSKGVHLFFVLSGFLISGLLLDRRHHAHYYKDFYLRRVLRILPAYLLMLAVLFLTHSITLRYLAVALLYLANMPRLLGATGEYGPLWSLAVEEQFYLVWPWLVRALSRKTLVRVCMGIVIGTPLLRFALLYGPAALQDLYTKTWVVGDFFASGTLLAVAVRTPSITEHGAQRLWKAVPVLLLAFVLTLTVQLTAHVPKGTAGGRVLAAIALEPYLFLSVALVLLGWLKPGIASMAGLRPLVFLANISYGLYLYHKFIFELIDRYWRIPSDGQISSFGWFCLRLVCELSVSIVVATISRYTLEEFFLRMKPKARPSGPLAPQLT